MTLLRLLVVALGIGVGALAGCGSVSGGMGAGAAGSGGNAGRGGVSGTGGGVAGAAGQDADTGDVPAVGSDAMDADTRKCTVKINEVQTGGAGGTSGALNEFIELYNTCPDRAFSLAGHSLVYRSATGTGDFPRVTFTAETIAAGKPYFVCANSGFVGNADIRYTDGLATDGALALRSPDGSIVDAVGWGAATNAIVETAAAPAPLSGQSIARVPDGHDSDDNSHDFVIAAQPTPGAAN
jgi:hypothetical protein